MAEKIEVSIDEVKRVFFLLEELNSLFHQPEKYSDVTFVSNFADSNYPEIKELYYQVVWEWLPKDIQKKIESR